MTIKRMSDEGKALASARHYPSKRLGQHFLKDARIIDRIVDSFSPQPDETVIEIGPGTGALTGILVERAARVIAVEFDNRLAPILRERFAPRSNFSLIEGDALQTEFCIEIQPATTARVVANLPYNISTAILQRLIAQRRCLTEMVLMLQREVVERILALPGSSDRGFLSVLVEAYCESEKLFDVAPGSFRPPPKIWSSVVRLRPRLRPAIAMDDEELLWQLVSAGFAHKRKTIFNNLRNAPGRLRDVVNLNGGASIVLCKADVGLQRRAETLTLEEWERILRSLL
jgi:16S rRNA (adenine1518-N6/adenine1519-N6)-dimethyltransferase